MKIYRTTSVIPGAVHWEQSSNGLFIACEDHIYRCESDDRLRLFSKYDEKAIRQFFGEVTYKGKVYVCPDSFQLNHFLSGAQKIFDKSGEPLELDSVKAAMISSMSGNVKNDSPLISFHINGFEGYEESTLFIYDQSDDSFELKQVDTYAWNYFFLDNTLVFPGDRNKIIGYDKKLNELWSFTARKYDQVSNVTFRSTFPAALSDQHFVMNIGHFDVERWYEDDSDDAIQMSIPKKGIVRSFYAKDGSLFWEREFEYSVDDLLVHEGRVFAFIHGHLHELSPKTGETINQVNTHPNNTSRTNDTYVSDMFVANDKLFICFYIKPYIHAYDINDFSKYTQVNLPGNWQPETVKIQHPETGDIYIGIREMPDPTVPIENRGENISGILQLNPERLGEPVEFESMPDITMELRPSEDQKKRDELWVEFDWPYLDDALRFGEIFIQNECKVQGYSFNGQQPNKRFNGKVHWRYSGCNEPAEKVREYLTKFEKRFNDWADETVLGGDRKEFCTIEAQYVEA